MEEQYKGHVIRVTTKKDNSAFPWKPFLKYRVNFLIASASSLARGSIGKSPLEFPGSSIVFGGVTRNPGGKRLAFPLGFCLTVLR